MRHVIAGITVLLVSFGVASADEFFATIKKVDGNKVTLNKGKKGEKVEDTTLTASEGVKVVKGKYNKDTKKAEAGEAIEGGLKSDALVKGNVRAVVVTNDAGQITEIRVVGGRGKKKKKVAF